MAWTRRIGVLALACAVGLVAVGCDNGAGNGAGRASSATTDAGSSSSASEVAVNPADMPLYAFAGQPIDVTGWFPGASYTVGDDTSGQPVIAFMVWPTEGWGARDTPITSGTKIGEINVPDGIAEVHQLTDSAGKPSAATASWSPAPGYSAILLLNNDDGSTTVSTLQGEAKKLIAVTQDDMLAALNGEGAKPENRPTGTLRSLVYPGHTTVRILSPGGVSIVAFDVDGQPADSVGLITYASEMRNTFDNLTGTEVKVRDTTGTIASASDRNGNRFKILVWKNSEGVTYSLRYPDTMDDAAATGLAGKLREPSGGEWSALLFPAEAVSPLGDAWINWAPDK